MKTERVHKYYRYNYQHEKYVNKTFGTCEGQTLEAKLFQRHALCIETHVDRIVYILISTASLYFPSIKDKGVVNNISKKYTMVSMVLNQRPSAFIISEHFFATLAPLLGPPRGA